MSDFQTLWQMMIDIKQCLVLFRIMKYSSIWNFKRKNPDLHIKSNKSKIWFLVIQDWKLFKVLFQQDFGIFGDEMDSSKSCLGIQANLEHCFYQSYHQSPIFGQKVDFQETWYFFAFQRFNLKKSLGNKTKEAFSLKPR